MKIINAGFEIENEEVFNGMLERIEKVGRTCYKSEDRITDESAPKFVEMIIKRGHEAMLEHGGMISVRFIVDRSVSHELIRHRISSFAQESTRYVASAKIDMKINNEEDVLYAYEKIGMSMKKISESSDGKYTEWDIYKILDENDIKRRNLGSRGIINENFFEIIDTPEKAYLLGLIFCDGSIKRDLSQLVISQKEDEAWFILNMLRDFIQPQAKTLNIHNKKICSDLVSKGIVPNKTYESTQESTDDLWNSIPYEYKYDFIRGLLDGDGSIRWFYQKQSSKTMSCNIQFCGNKHIMDKLSSFIKQEFDYEAKVKMDSESKVLFRVGVYDSIIGKELCDKMYAHFKFPYGHSKTARYYEAFNKEIPIKKYELRRNTFNVIKPLFRCDSKKSLWLWGYAMMSSEMIYTRLLELGAQPQEARSVLPNSLKTEIVMSANPREWRAFFKLRTPETAHPQMREVTRPLLDKFKELVPVLFDDINY